MKKFVAFFPIVMMAARWGAAVAAVGGNVMGEGGVSGWSNIRTPENRIN